jgi:hypothetical protein
MLPKKVDIRMLHIEYHWTVDIEDLIAKSLAEPLK